MMHITEDTPPDMLAGAMDLTVHLPNGRSVKMSVERCTPMMDVLMQITAAHHLQLSGYVIEALGMAPSSEHSDKILPYKPNTPIGTLDTQHIRVVQKARTLPVPKNIAPGHQPFESTFRLKVHLPRKQLFVSRVSMNVLLEDIMRKVCDEKNLDPSKYEFRHPDNQNEVLDPKLTLEHYKITEIYVVSKGSSRLSQAFSASDIMALRKDEERKQSKSSGGVFNLIFKRGKMSNGSGSLSSDNRSISPTHSDDSRSVTPPAIQQQIIKAPAEKPKAPQRKRRPAPKPPQPKEETKPPVEETPTENPKKNENGLTICHSRNSSDSSGYHEASILSDNANTSLPRRPQTMIISEDVGRNKLNGEHSKSTSNLTSMSLQSKSTSSLAFAGRKKKAPPPPPVLKTASSVTNLEKASPVVASPVEQRELPTAISKKERLPVPVPRKFKATEEAKLIGKHLRSEEISKLEGASIGEDPKVGSFTKFRANEENVMPERHYFGDQIDKDFNTNEVNVPAHKTEDRKYGNEGTEYKNVQITFLEKDENRKLKQNSDESRKSDGYEKYNEEEIYEEPKKIKGIARDDFRRPRSDFYKELKQVVHKKSPFSKLNETSEDPLIQVSKTDEERRAPKLNQITKEPSIQILESDEGKRMNSKDDDFKKPKEEIYEELKKFTHEKFTFRQTSQTHILASDVSKSAQSINDDEDDIYEELKNFSHEKLQLKLSLELDDKSSGVLEAVEAKNLNMKKPKESIKKSLDVTRPYELTEELEMKKYEEEDFPVMISKLGSNMGKKTTSESKQNYNASETVKSDDLLMKDNPDEVTRPKYIDLKMTTAEAKQNKFTSKTEDLMKEETEKHGLIFSGEIYTDEFARLNKEKTNKHEPVLSREIYAEYPEDLKEEKPGKHGPIVSGEIYADKSIDVRKKEIKEHGANLAREIYVEDLKIEKHETILPRESVNLKKEETGKDRPIDPKERYIEETIDLRKEGNNGEIVSRETHTDTFRKKETERHRSSLSTSKQTDPSKQSEIIPRGKQDDEVKKHMTPDGTVLNLKETMMIKTQRNAKYEREKSFSRDSDEEIIEATAGLMSQIKSSGKKPSKKVFKPHSTQNDKNIIIGNTQEFPDRKSDEACKAKPNLIHVQNVNQNTKFGSNLKSKISLFEAEGNHSKNLEDKSQNSYKEALENIDIDLFNPKYRRNPMPLFPKTNDLEKSTNAFDTFTRKRGFGIGRAMLDLEDDKADAMSVSSTASNRVYSEYGDDEMSDVNVDMFAAPDAPMKTNSANAMDELMGMHSFKPKDILKKRHSAASLLDARNIPGFNSIRKWSNTEELDGSGSGSKWVVGDSDSEPIVPKHSEDPIMAGQQFTTNSPPESIASSLATTLSSNIETDINLSKENSEIVENEPEEKIPEVTPPENTFLPIQNTEVVDEPEWQYRLPSPPTAFRDSSPTLVENLTVYESTEQFKSDSVVTSPELFEKLKLVRESQSVSASVVSEEEKPIFNKLSLENLEKRKSLVYNRELATSLKYKDDDSQKTESISSKRSSVLSELEEVISNSKSSTLNKNVKSDNFIHSDSNLPNFKITTYDMPKKKINIFEDDSIRSNENSCKFNAAENISSLLKKSYMGRSMENLALRKEDGFKKPAEFNGNRYKAKTLMRADTEATTVGRSESFSAANWVPINPVKRSKSQVAINQYKEEMNGTSSDGTLSKSNSLFDVSGLQSLEVMRLIQTKLKTPSNSTDELDRKEPAKPIKEKNPIQVPENTQPKHQQPEHRYGPPSINLGTWSERPKSQITLKEDTDYKFNTSNTKLIASTNNKNLSEELAHKPTVNVRVNGMQQNLSIKVNGTESITPQPSGNVIIKIGGNEKKDDGFASRFINHTTAVGFRKPLGNVNTLEKQRPHSVAFDSNFDISRVPIVRSVELKKPFKDMHINRSITQICPQNDVETKSLNYSVNAKTNPVLRINSFSQNNQTDYTTNKNVPFAQVKLRRTDSNKNVQLVNNNNNNNIFGNVVLRNTSNRFSTGNVVEKPPPPPMMPKTASYIQPTKPRQNSTDPRDELLSAIRNFGGKKGLKPQKV